MNATERKELSNQIREQLRELKTTLDGKLPIIGNDVKYLEESEELVNRATGESRKLPYERDLHFSPKVFLAPLI